MSRRAEATTIARHLTRAIADLAPADVGKRDEVWQAVDQPSAAFMSALHTWEASGEEADKQRLRVAYKGLLGAWRTALRDDER